VSGIEQAAQFLVLVEVGKAIKLAKGERRGSMR
jgi:hypothetical protein